MNESITPLSITGGIFLQSTKQDFGFHLDSSHINASKDALGVPMDKMGVIEPWITSGAMGDPGSWMKFTSGETKEVDGELWTYDVALPSEPVYILEDLSNSDKPGIDGQVFKLRLNKRAFGNTAVVKFQPTDDFELRVTEDEIIKEGDSFIFTFKVRSSKKNMYCPKSRLVYGTKIMRMSSQSSEFNDVWDDLSMSSQKASYFNYVATTSANKHYTVSETAATSSVTGENIIAMDKFRETIEMHIMRPDTVGFHAQLHGVKDLGHLKEYENYKTGRGDGFKNYMKDMVSATWMPKVELTYRKSLELEVENSAIWSSGGVDHQAGKTINLPVGLFHQQNNGNKHSYSLNRLNKGILSYMESIISSYQCYHQDAFDDTTVLNIRVGAGLMAALQPILNAQPQLNGMTLNGDKYLTKTEGGYKYDAPVYNMFKTVYGWLKFTVDPSLNPMHDLDISNPIITGNFRLSSYMAIVDDFSGEGNNICTIRQKGGWDTKQFFENGKSDYFGSLHNFHGKSVPYGFKVVMQKAHKAYWLKDRTKSLMIKPINPSTGIAFGETTY